MDWDKLFYFIAGGALLQSLVLCIFLLRRAPASLARALLIAILAAGSLNILHALTMSPGILMEPMQFLLPPLLSAYVKALVDPEFRLKPRHLMHLAPALLVTLLSLFFAGLPAQEAELGRGISIVLWIALLLQASVYLHAAIRDMRRYRESLKAQVSNLRGADPSWLRLFSWVLHGIYVFYTLVPFLVLHLPSLHLVRNYISLVLAVSLCVICYRQLLGKAAAPRKPTEPHRTYPPELPEILDELMRKEKLYLQPELDLDALSRRLGWSRNEVSAAINGHFGLNFYDYVNGFRIREVQSLMEDPKRRQFTIVALAFDAGFNSKPTFNAVFKKQTGLTPSQYQRKKKQV